MAHHHERAHVHTSPARSAPGRPRPAGSAARIDCDTCPVAGLGCADCMVALLGPVHLGLDAHERAAVDRLVDFGLVSPEDARAAYAVPDLPDWVVAARGSGEEEPRLRAIG